MSVEIKWIHHASFRLSTESVVFYIDPWKLEAAQPDADVVLVSHEHFDHFSADDVSAVSGDDTVVVASADVADKIPEARALRPGESIEVSGVGIEGVPAYNVDKDFHPRSNAWLGIVVTIDGVRVYYAGDTDQIPEMGALSDIDLALLPAGGTYTMTASQAVEAARAIGPRVAMPYHWGDIVGTEDDARAFVDAVTGCEAKLLHPGETLTL